MSYPYAIRQTFENHTERQTVYLNHKIKHTAEIAHILDYCIDLISIVFLEWRELNPMISCSGILWLPIFYFMIIPNRVFDSISNIIY